MPQDAFTLRHLCRELNSLFSGGKINKIVQSSCDKMVFSVYTESGVKRLLLSVDPACSRIGVTETDEKTLEILPFCQLLKKHLTGAKINGINLCGFDRIVKIDLTPSKEFFDAPDKVLYVELMGRYSNVILTENGKILGGNRGINMFDDGVRPLFTGHDYVFPPTNDKKLPTDQALIEVFKNCTDVVDIIIKNVQGVAKSTAKWIVDEYNKQIGMQDVCAYINDNPLDFFTYMNNRLYNENTCPCVEIKDGEVVDVYCTPYGDKEYKFFDKLYLAEDYFFTEKNKRKTLSNLKERLTSLVNTGLKKAGKRLNAINQKKKDAESLEDNRIKGELIIANIYKIKRGDKLLIADNYYDGTKVEISLDENLSPAENGNLYYKKYAKQKRTLEAILPQLEMANSELEYWRSVEEEVSLCETADDFNHVLNELKPPVKIKQKKRVDELASRVYEKDGFIIRVGRSNVENDKLVSTAKRDSIWIHVKDYHSSHVLIEANGKSVPIDVIKFGAEISAYYSKCRDGGKAEVVYTERKHVKKPSGAKPGFVIYDNFKSIVVEANKHEEFIKAN